MNYDQPEIIKEMKKAEKTKTLSSLRSEGIPLSRISELIGKPKFKPEKELNDAALATALREITALIKKNKLSIDFIGTYSKRLRYKFITEEFIEKKIAAPAQNGSSLGFIYEEFHPDHKLALKERALKFIHALFGRKTGTLFWELDDQLGIPDGNRCSREKLMSCVYHFFDRYRDFKKYQYSIDHISFDLMERDGSGYTEGFVKFTALTARNVVVCYEGSFKLWFTLNDGWWSVQYFTFPGFDTGPELQNSE